MLSRQLFRDVSDSGLQSSKLQSFRMNDGGRAKVRPQSEHESAESADIVRSYTDRTRSRSTAPIGPRFNNFECLVLIKPLVITIIITYIGAYTYFDNTRTT